MSACSGRASSLTRITAWGASTESWFGGGRRAGTCYEALMRLWRVLLIPAAAWLGAATVDAASGGADEHGGHPPLGAHADVLEIPAGASPQVRLELMKADFRAREHRIDWKSDSVRKRIRWALDDAEEALAAGDVDAAEPRLDDARTLLEQY